MIFLSLRDWCPARSYTASKGKVAFESCDEEPPKSVHITSSLGFFPLYSLQPFLRTGPRDGKQTLANMLTTMLRLELHWQRSESLESDNPVTTEINVPPPWPPYFR